MLDTQTLPLLTVKNLSFKRNEISVFKSLSFSVNSNQTLFVYGDNGSGKTTLLRVLAGLLRPDHGEIKINKNHANLQPYESGLAYLGHTPALKNDLTALENLEFLCGLHGTRHHCYHIDALEMFGLTQYKMTLVYQLSAGLKKRLALAWLWTSPMLLWLLDEPYTHLDPLGIDIVNHAICEHLHNGGAAVITTHGTHSMPNVPTHSFALV